MLILHNTKAVYLKVENLAQTTLRLSPVSLDAPQSDLNVQQIGLNMLL